MSQVEDSVAPIAEVPAPEPKSLGRLLFSGTSALGAATLIERGLGFIANFAAARLGGVHVFGAYSIAMTTANNVAAYAGAGIGTTANRFSGEYPYGSPGYGGLLRTLSLVCVGSSLLAAGILWFAAEPLAVHVIRNPGLTHLLRLASISAGAIILLECLRGLLIGQRRFVALLAMSALFGVGMLVALPLAARMDATHMVVSQAVIALSAIALCVLAAKKLQFSPPADKAKAKAAGPTAGTIMRFGGVQLAGMVGLNAAGWWVASMVARSDVSLVQAGWFSLAMQLRNMCAMPAGLISQTAYAQLTESGGEGYGGANRVTILSTIAAVLVSLSIAGPIAALTPWLVTLYGKDFRGAELAATLAIATGLVHMSSAPAAARLTVVSLPMTGAINGTWSVLLFGLGTWLVPSGGAAEAALCFFLAHVFSAVAVLGVLLWRGSASRELLAATLPALCGAVLIAGFSWIRAFSPHKAEFSGLILLLTLGMMWVSFHRASKISTVIRDLTFAKIASAIAARSGLAFARR